MSNSKSKTKSNRLKVVAAPPAIKSREELEEAVHTITQTKIYQCKIIAEMDERITGIKKEYQTELAAIEEAIKPKLQAVANWAEAHPDEFGKRKSLELVHGTIGWRTGTPALKTLKGFTWAKVLEKVKGLGWVGWIRTKQEVDKEAILAVRKDLTQREMTAIGVYVSQTESFFVEPKLTEVKTKETVEA